MTKKDEIRLTGDSKLNISKAKRASGLIKKLESVIPVFS